MKLNPLILPAGSLRCLTAIQKQTTSKDDFQQPQATWTTVVTVMTSIEEAAAGETYQAGASTSTVTHILKFPWVAVPISAGMQAVYGAHIYKVLAVTNVLEKNKVLKLKAIEIDGAE